MEEDSGYDDKLSEKKKKQWAESEQISEETMKNIAVSMQKKKNKNPFFIY